MRVFRLIKAPLHHKNNTEQVFLGICRNDDDGAQIAKDLRAGPFAHLDWIKAIATGFDLRPESTLEQYFADLGDWWPDILEYGVEQLRADLVAAGFRDASAD